MKRTVATALLVATSLLFGANPAAGLSCVQPEPVDMKAAIAAADAAAIGTITSITSISSSDDELFNESLLLTVHVSEVFKGTVPSRLTLERFSSVWGPFYEEGAELALLVHDGVVRDGQDSLCGPYFYPADMRQAGGEPTHPEPEPQGWFVFDLWRSLLDLLGQLLGR